MPTLGATLEDLLDLKVRLDASALEIDHNNDQARQTTDTMVEQLNDQAGLARNQIVQFMDALTTDVGQVYSQTATGTDWTGNNKELFTDNYQTFQTSMSSAADATTGYFEQLATVVSTMMGDLKTFQTQLQTDLNTAQEASTSMGVAVQGQHDNLDAAMNTGMTFG